MNSQSAGRGNPVENEDVSHKDSQHYYCDKPLISCGNYPDTGGALLITTLLGSYLCLAAARLRSSGFGLIYGDLARLSGRRSDCGPVVSVMA